MGRLRISREVDLDADDGAAGAGKFADLFEVAAVDEGGDVAYMRGLAADGVGVGEGELVGRMPVC